MVCADAHDFEYYLFLFSNFQKCGASRTFNS